MIFSVLNTISARLNSFLQNRFGISEDTVVLSGIADRREVADLAGEGKMVVTLVNVQEKVISGKVPSTGGNKRPVDLNLFILFSAAFSKNNYQDALMYLSAVIGFFQANNVLTPANTPDLHPAVDKLTFEIVNQSLHEQSQLWRALGGQYLPSIVYKMRMIRIDEGGTDFNTPRLTGIASNDF